MSSEKLRNLGTQINPNTIREYNDGYRFILPAAMGKIGYITIAAPWCGHCNVLSESMKVARQKLNFPSYYINGDDQSSKAIMQQLGVEGFPTMFVFDRDGKLYSYQQGRDPQSLITGIS